MLLPTAGSTNVDAALVPADTRAGEFQSAAGEGKAGEMDERTGYGLKLVSLAVWQEHLPAAGESNALFPLFPCLSVYLRSSVAGERQMLIAKVGKVGRTFTARLLCRLELQYPGIDRELWHKYARYCSYRAFWSFPLSESTV
jgi:hypothetical protein